MTDEAHGTKEKELAKKMFDVAFALIERAEGNIELARGWWNETFEEAERIEHNQSHGEPDEFERAVAEQTERFVKAAEARREFHVIKPKAE